jgi:crotonobetainyl-CoA:carnitine CoA-transferase CaiB-like acyl-CoA transferase
LVELLDARVITRPAAEWVERLREFDVPCTIIQDYEMIAGDEQARANGYIHEEEHPVWGHVVTQGPVAQFSKTPAEVRRSAPVHPGQDSATILQEAGFSPDEIQALQTAGVVHAPERHAAGAGGTVPGASHSPA